MDFEPVPLDAEQEAVSALIRTKGKELADAILLLPPGRRRSVALTNLESTIMWANKAVAKGDA